MFSHILEARKLVPSTQYIQKDGLPYVCSVENILLGLRHQLHTPKASIYQQAHVAAFNSGLEISNSSLYVYRESKLRITDEIHR